MLFFCIFDQIHAVLVSMGDFMYDTNLNKYIEAKAVDVIDVSQSKQTGEKTTGQHAHSQVQTNGQTLSNDSTEKIVLNVTADRMLAANNKHFTVVRRVQLLKIRPMT